MTVAIDRITRPAPNADPRVIRSVAFRLIAILLVRASVRTFPDLRRITTQNRKCREADIARRAVEGSRLFVHVPTKGGDMTVAIDRITRPAPNANPRVDTGHRKVGIGIGVIGLIPSQLEEQRPSVPAETGCHCTESGHQDRDRLVLLRSSRRAGLLNRSGC